MTIEIQPLEKVERDELRKQCGAFLKANQMRVGTVTAAKAIHAFWYGVLCARGTPDDPYVVLCLLSGRHADLVDTRPKEA